MDMTPTTQTPMSPVTTPSGHTSPSGHSVSPRPPKNAPAGYIRLTDVANGMGVSSQALRYWVTTGSVTGFPVARKLAGKMLIFEITELRAYFQRNGVDCKFLDNYQAS